MFYVGIDIAKRTHEAAIIDERGAKLCKPFSFPNSAEGCEKILDVLTVHDNDYLTSTKIFRYITAADFDETADGVYELQISSVDEMPAFTVIELIITIHEDYVHIALEIDCSSYGGYTDIFDITVTFGTATITEADLRTVI